MEGPNSTGSLEIHGLSVWLKLSCPGLVIKVSCLIPLAMLLAALAGFLDVYLLMYGSIIAHELAHIFTAAAFGMKTRSVMFFPTGLCASLDDAGQNNPWNLLVLLGGPFANLLVYFVITGICMLYGIETGSILFFAEANLYLAILNLFPVLPLDGGKILRLTLSLKRGYILAGRLTYYISLCFSSLITAVGFGQLLYSKANFSLLCIGIYVIYATSSEKAEASLMSIKQIIYRRSRLLKKGIYQARDLAVMMDTHLSEIIKSMDYDRFHIIYVLNSELRIKEIFTEQEIMEALLDNDTDMTFANLISIKKQAKGES